jgi:hypothetical protein
LFLYATAVQYNDPDPLRWMAAYGIGAALSGLAAVRGSVPVRLAFGWAAACVVFAVLDAALGVGQTDPMGGFPHWGALRGEITREVLGLLLMAGWTAVLAWWTRYRTRSEE